MVIITHQSLILKKKNIWFADSPFDVEGCGAVFFFSCKKNVETNDFLKEESPTLVIDLRKSLDEIWKNMAKKSCRYFINRAKREGIEVKINTSYPEFMNLYADFSKTKNFHTTIIGKKALKRAPLFTAYLQSELLAGIILVEDEKNIKWLMGASKRLESDKSKSTLISCANRLLIWEAIKYAKEKGISEFDFGGYYTGSDENHPLCRVNQFKRQFGGTPVTYYNYKKYYSKLYATLKKFKNLLR